MAAIMGAKSKYVDNHGKDCEVSNEMELKGRKIMENVKNIMD